MRFPLACKPLTTVFQMLTWFWDLEFLIGFECVHFFRDSFTDGELGILLTQQELGPQVCTATLVSCVCSVCAVINLLGCY